jgi:hypothetical protein
MNFNFIVPEEWKMGCSGIGHNDRLIEYLGYRTGERKERERKKIWE